MTTNFYFHSQALQSNVFLAGHKQGDEEEKWANIAEDSLVKNTQEKKGL